MEENALEQSKRFWKALEKADVETMREIANPNSKFVHIGTTCGLDKEMQYFIDKIFVPTDVKINSQEVEVFGNTAIVITDCDYGLLLDGKETTHHFAVTEVYVLEDNEFKLVQFTFTNLIY